LYKALEPDEYLVKAKRAVCPPQARLAHMCMRLGVVLQGVDDVELPEQMLVSLYLNELDPARECTFAPDLAAYLLDEANRVPPLV